jgi:hypothetical protein
MIASTKSETVYREVSFPITFGTQYYRQIFGSIIDYILSDTTVSPESRYVMVNALNDNAKCQVSVSSQMRSRTNVIGIFVIGSSYNV